ncbi:hypothetical protein GEMRC1_006022 [Eukaryota sp. GEM-RC1]
MLSAALFVYIAVPSAISILVFCLIGGMIYFPDLYTIPYISYVSGRYPFLPIFSGGMTIAGTCIATLCVLYTFVFYRRSPDLFKHVGKFLIVVGFLSTIGGFCLAALSLVSVYDNFILHGVFAQTFFWTNMVSNTIIVFLSKKEHKQLRYKNEKVAKHARFWIKYRLYNLILLPVVVIPYLLFPAFVDVEKHVWVNSLCALLQYISVMLVISFYGSLAFDLRSFVIKMEPRESLVKDVCA